MYKSVMGRIILVPTSHVAEESVRKIEQVISQEKPDCIAVELDAARLASLQHPGGKIPFSQLGAGGFLIIWIMKKLQEKLGEKAGILPGAEMLKAIEIAKTQRITAVLIDRPILETFMKIKSIPFREKGKLLWLLMKGVTMSVFYRREKINLKTVPGEELIEQALAFLKKELPYFSRILIEERDRHMAEQLLHLNRHYNTVVAVVGAGHKEGIMKLLKA